MANRRWVYIGCEAVEVGADYVPAARTVADSVLWNDRAYQDMNDKRFNSRTQHREFMKQHNLSTIDDYSEEWKVKEGKRNEAKQGVDPSRREDIDRAIHQLSKRR